MTRGPRVDVLDMLLHISHCFCFFAGDIVRVIQDYISDGVVGFVVRPHHFFCFSALSVLVFFLVMLNIHSQLLVTSGAALMCVIVVVQSVVRVTKLRRQ